MILILCLIRKGLKWIKTISQKEITSQTDKHLVILSSKTDYYN